MTARRGLLALLLWARALTTSSELSAPSPPPTPSSPEGRRATEFFDDEFVPGAPPSPPYDATAFTHVTFFNVGACTTVLGVQFQFEDKEAPQSGLLTRCPLQYQVIEGDNKLCRVPGPYGVAVSVTFNGVVTELEITLVDPTDEEGDANVTVPTMIQLPGQKRNFVTSALTTDSDAAEDCRFVVAAINQTDIPAGHFRASFLHHALGVGNAQPFSNGDGLLGTLAPGEGLFHDHRLMGCCDSLQQELGDIGISFKTDSGGTVDMLRQGQGFNQAPWYLNATCENSTVLFVLYGAPADDKELRVLRVDGGDQTGVPTGGTPNGCSYEEASLGVFGVELATCVPTLSLTLSPALIPTLSLSPSAEP